VALKANPNARAVARQVGGVSGHTVWKIANQTGIDLAAGKTVNNLPPEKRPKIIVALKANPNASAVARKVGGVSEQTVRKIAKQIGIDLAAQKQRGALFRQKSAQRSSRRLKRTPTQAPSQDRSAAYAAQRSGS
jgi:hypothetical protein